MHWDYSVPVGRGRALGGDMSRRLVGALGVGCQSQSAVPTVTNDSALSTVTNDSALSTVTNDSALSTVTDDRRLTTND